MAIRRKKEGEYHTGRLNISCSPAQKDAIAASATEQGKSISSYLLDLYEASRTAGSSESLARMGLEVVGLKKRLVDVETQLRRHLARSQGTLDKTVADDLRTLRELEGQIDLTLRELVDTVKALKAKGLQARACTHDEDGPGARCSRPVARCWRPLQGSNLRPPD